LLNYWKLFYFGHN